VVRGPGLAIWRILVVRGSIDFLLVLPIRRVRPAIGLVVRICHVLGAHCTEQRRVIKPNGLSRGISLWRERNGCRRTGLPVRATLTRLRRRGRLRQRLLDWGVVPRHGDPLLRLRGLVLWHGNVLGRLFDFRLLGCRRRLLQLLLLHVVVVRFVIADPSVVVVACAVVEDALEPADDVLEPMHDAPVSRDKAFANGDLGKLEYF